MLPFRGLTGGNMVLLELANRLAARGHLVWMLFAGDDVPWWKARARVRLTLREKRLRPWIDWFDLRVPVIRRPRLEERSVPDADAIVIAADGKVSYSKGLQPPAN